MTAKDYKKAYNQLSGKPGKLAKYEKHNSKKERSCGKAKVSCQFTGTTRGVIKQYGLNVCRRYFRLNAKKLGFKKLN